MNQILSFPHALPYNNYEPIMTTRNWEYIQINVLKMINNPTKGLIWSGGLPVQVDRYQVSFKIYSI
jgi:hypothetical protein